MTNCILQNVIVASIASIRAFTWSVDDLGTCCVAWCIFSWALASKTG